MIFHKLNNDGWANHSEGIERGGDSIILDGYLHFEGGETLYAYELDTDQNLIPFTDLTIEGRFYTETDGDYDDLGVGDDLGGSDGYLRYLIRITADAGTSVLDKDIRFVTL
jgi:hypothetical protein